MSAKYKFIDAEGCYFVTYATVCWVDVFTRNTYKEILLESWRYCQAHKDLRIHAWVIMPNHVHMIISANDKATLPAIMRDIKKYTASMLLKAIKSNPQESRKEWMLRLFGQAGAANSNNKTFQFWQQSNHPILLDTLIKTRQRLDYLHENPVRAGFVEKPEDWTYSSGIDYYTERKGLISIEHLLY